VDDAALLDHLTDWIDRGRERFQGPGIVLGLTDRERTLGTLTLGDSGPGDPLREDHRFLIASVSKSFTAALVMQEAAAGSLSLEDPVTRFLPWFTPANPSGPITLHHLLTHTAGIATGYDVTGDAAEELLLLRQEVVASVPGTHHVYSNAGYKALGLVLEQLAGRPWWELVRERIFEPLGMTATEPVISGDVRPLLAQGWVPPLDDRPWHPDHGLVHASWFESYTADGTIASTGLDMAAYVRMYLNDGGDVLRPEDVERMTRGDVDDPDTGSR
jgi:D-alanyl-D-alanine carboxypeptidase